MIHFLVFTLLFLAMLGFLAWLSPFVFSRYEEYTYIHIVIVIFACAVFCIGIAGYISMLPLPSPTTVQITENTFKPSNINSESVRFVNNTSQSFVLCLAEYWQCNTHLSGWCRPSYQFPGWISDWFPRAFIDCTAVGYIKLYARQQVVMNFEPSEQAYEIMVQGNQAMRLVLKNPPSSDNRGEISGGGGGDNGGGGGSGGDGGGYNSGGGNSVNGGGSSVNGGGDEDDDDGGGGGSGGGGGDDGGDD